MPRPPRKVAAFEEWDRKHELAPVEKVGVVRTYLWVQENLASGVLRTDETVAKITSTISHVSERTVQRILDENEETQGRFEKTREKGRPPFKLDGDVLDNVVATIRRRNAAVPPEPCTTRFLMLEHAEELGEISETAVRDALKRRGFSCKVGSRLAGAHEAPAQLILRSKFLFWHEKHRGPDGNPFRPEVFLDESFAHPEHNARKTWQKPGDMLHFQSRGHRVCFIAAGIVWAQYGHLHGGMVEGSLKIFCAKKGSKNKKVKTSGEDEDMAVLAAMDSEDYHSNFTPQLFEQWFEQLCATLTAKHGSCKIFLDGAKYHRRRLDAIPTPADKKDVIKKWLTEQNIAFDDASTKKRLLDIVHGVKDDKKVFAVVEIAKKHGHDIQYTPPYHPELQPIEEIWAHAKNKLALIITPTAKDVITALRRIFAEDILEEHWVAAYRHCVARERAYLAAEDQEVEGELVRSVEDTEEEEEDGSD